MKRGKKRQKVDTIEKLAVLVAEGFSEIHGELGEFRNEFQDIRGDLKGIHAELSEVNRRLDRLEEQAERQAGYAKEIDHLFGRMSRVEKHLKLT